MNNLAYLLSAGAGDLDQALAHRARELPPDHAEVSDTLAWI